MIGNDVVDLDVMRARPQHPGFAERVCSSSELRVLRASPDPRRTLWSFFAAKEAAYKAMSKLVRVRFTPRAFEVGAELGWVQHRGERLRLEVMSADGFVHACAWSVGAPAPWRVVRIDDERLASAAVRRLARELTAAQLGCDSSAIEVRRDPEPDAWDGHGPPRLSLHGRSLPLDVSLSHHGSYAACAVEKAWRAST